MEAKNLLFLLTTVVLMGVAIGDCELPPKDDPILNMAIECQKEFGTKLLCVGDCLARSLELMNENGDIDRSKTEATLDNFQDGDLKEAVIESWKKCFKSVTSIDRKKPECTGFHKVGKCVRKIMQQKCPSLVKMVGL